MKDYTFYFELQDCIEQFSNILAGAVLKRHTISRVPSSEINVRMVYGPKQRVFQNIVNKADNFTMPVVAFNMKDISVAKDNFLNKIEGWHHHFEGFNAGKYRQPIPIKISVDVGILTKNTSDLNEIISNFAPYFDPYVAFSWQRWGLSGLHITNKIYWSGSGTPTIPESLAANQDQRVEFSTQFSIHTWLFKKDENPVGLIHKIDLDFFPVKELRSYEILQDIENDLTKDNFILSAIPEIKSVYPFQLDSENGYNPLTFFGKNFDFLEEIYLSSSNLEMFGTSADYFNLFSGTSLSSSFPAFSGMQLSLDNFSVLEPNMMTVTFPQLCSKGYVDVILKNDAGFSRMTLTTKPLSSFTYHFPFESGIQIT